MGVEQVADVVVVGYGAAGVCAALEARSGGADVVALDRANGGGAAALSGGIIYAGGGTVVQAEAGVDDCAERMLSYLRLEVGDAVRPETLNWLRSHGVSFDATVCPYKTSDPNNKNDLYYSGGENSGRFGSIARPERRRHRASGLAASGKKIYRPLAAAAIPNGVRTQIHTRALSLLTDPDGRVGVRASVFAGAPALSGAPTRESGRCAV